MKKSRKKVRIGVLASGSGSNFQAILEATRSAVLSFAEIVVVISNKKAAVVLQRARHAGIKSEFLDPSAYPNRKKYFEKIIKELKNRKVDLVCLAGFLLKLEPNIIRSFPDRILNIHPALLPEFGGKGMYGHFVHEAVLESGKKESGCTVHLVDEEYDHGEILLQKKVPVLANDSPESLAARILKQEHLLYPEAIRQFVLKELKF